MSVVKPDGYTIGWNVGAPAGQTVFHAHLHVMYRFAGDQVEGRGIAGLLRLAKETNSKKKTA